MNLEKRLLEIKEELKKLRGSIATAKDEELDGIQEDINKLETEKKSVEKRISMMATAQRAAMQEDGEDDDAEDDDAEGEGEEDDAPAVRNLGGVGETAAQRRAAARREKRAQMGKDLKASRTVILDASVLVPKPQSSTLTGFPFNQVSNILEAVSYIDIPNGETFDAPYITETGMGDYTDQPSAAGTGGEYHEVSLGWDTVTINKTKITAYGEITKELEKTPVAGYADAVENNISLSLRKKLAREVVSGDGATGHFVGILSSAVKANTVTDYNLGAINENTLDELVLNYGGEEDIESKMGMLLNKLTLLAFSKVRGTADKRKVYTIDYTNNTIDGIKFFTSSSVKDFTSAATGDAFLAYGDFNKYQIAVFSNIETAKSTDYKFRQGITAFRGDVYMGGNIVGFGSFIRVFKAATSVTTLTKKENI